MHICLFTENHYKGGLDTFIINLINSWPDSEDKLTLMCNGSHSGLKNIENKIYRTLKIRRYYRFFTSGIATGTRLSKFTSSLPIRIFFILAFKLIQYPVILPWYLLTLTHTFYKSDYEYLIVINGGYPASLLGRCAVIAWYISGKKHKAIFNFHNSAMPIKWYEYIPEYLIDKAVAKSSSCIVSVSDDCLNSIKIRPIFSTYKNMFRIYNGIEDPYLYLSNTYSFNKKDKRYCLMLATYEPRKGHAFLLNAFKLVVQKLPEVRLLIYGHGKNKEKQKIIDLIVALDLVDTVELHSFSNETSCLINAAEVLVVPSQAYESFGLTIIEAMALKTPVVVTDVGGMPEVLESSSAGYVCSRSDSIAFANAIIRVLKNPIEAKELGNNGRKVYEERFTARVMAMQYYALLLKGYEDYEKNK